MSNAEKPLHPQMIYLLKVISGLALLGLIVGSAFWLPLSGVSQLEQGWGLSGLLIAAVALFPLVQWKYRRMDELQRLLHQNSSVITLPMLASLFCLIGILQAAEIIPLFNQFWFLGILVAVWGVNLMLADRRFR